MSIPAANTKHVTPPLFEGPPRVTPEPKQRSAASVAWGNCPGCRKGRIGAVRTAEHLVWREHTYTTWGGARMTCTASGVPVCRLTERQPTERVAGRVACDHESGGVC